MDLWHFCSYELSNEVLTSLGVSLVGRVVSIPLYTRKKMVVDRDLSLPGLTVSRVVDVDPETQYYVSIVLQITDGCTFKR